MSTNIKQTIRRLAIFFFYDKDGIVDDYVIFLLNDLKKNIDELLIVCNGLLTPDGREKISKITEKILVRENKGFDVWAYKEGIETLGWDYVRSFDELILLNFTIFGPIYPFKEMFDVMDSQDLDFWGITKYHSLDFDPIGLISYNYLPEHIQSHFIAIRKRMLNSFEFKSYWEEMRMIGSYDEAVAYHEAIFTKKFADKGFTWAVYVKTDDLKEFTTYPLMFMPYELVKNRRCPIIKRKSTFLSYYTTVNETSGESAFKVLDYLEKSTSYDINMIWENILRTQDLNEIKKNLQLNFILSESYSSSKKTSAKKIATVFHLDSMNLLHENMHYFQSLPKNTDFYITTSLQNEISNIQQKFAELTDGKVLVSISEKGAAVKSLLTKYNKLIDQYDYICFVNDFQDQNKKPQTVELGNLYRCYENLLLSNHLVENIIDLFENNPKLGILFPPPPSHGYYGMSYCHEWMTHYEESEFLLKKMNITVPFSLESESITSIGNMFWFRPKALNLLLDHQWNLDEFTFDQKHENKELRAIERTYSYFAQQSGYFSAWVFSEKYAKIEITNLDFLFRRERLVNGLSTQSLLSVVKTYIRIHFPKLTKFFLPIYGKAKHLRRML